MTPLAAAASREIVDLHAEIEALFTGRSRDFSRCERAFSPDMHMVTPEGRLITRADILERFRKAKVRELRITIRDAAVIHEDAGSVLLRYIEEQYRDGETSRRRSVALFEAASHASCGVAWRFLQETWISA